MIGGGLLGLEAAKAVLDLGLETHVVEFAPRLMPRQLDAAGASLLNAASKRSACTFTSATHDRRARRRAGRSARARGRRATRRRPGGGLGRHPCRATSWRATPGSAVRARRRRRRRRAAHQRPAHLRDRRGRAPRRHRPTAWSRPATRWPTCSRAMRPTDGGRVERFGASVFAGADLSTKLKLLGVDVASFGDPFADAVGDRVDHVRGPGQRRLQEAGRQQRRPATARRHPGRRRVRLRALRAPGERGEADAGVARAADLRAGGRGSRARACRTRPRSARATTSASARSRARSARRSSSTLGEVKACTKAGTGLRRLHAARDRHPQRRAQGSRARRDARACASTSRYTRQELFEIVKIKRHRELRRAARQPRHAARAARSASRPWRRSWRASGTSRSSTTRPLQDTNDRFLANIQRGGTYSVVPRIPGGEITPDKLIALGQVAQEVRPLHQDHRRPAHRPVRRARRSAARHLGRAGRRRLRERPRLRQGDAHREELRRHHAGAATACRTRSASRSASRSATRASARRTSSSRRSAAASASAPRRRARTSA